ncbi:inositol hexakisphosphate and diphosphoinositol-pentakisphosphate kinase 2 isoform X6 [Ochotona curzoniae]|nr:inositol hexakisphosphate and diphosphoinositol-pentakisphosphate kinase 2 isoform X6 [Ochotona curzoniae]
MSEAPRFFVGPEDAEINPGSCRHFFHHADEEEEEEDESPPERQIVVGICSMAKKSKSKPMKEILERISLFKYITVVVFEEEVILNEPVENWPLCDCLISFHSKGFPLDKAVAYAKLRNPFVINDLNMQYLIQDRREVYSILQAEGILLPRYAILNRDPNNPKECNLIEGEDHVEVNGEVFQKPFVEKPVSAEDHNVYIYYPTSAGGGSQRLFRKIGSRSSVYSPESNVRKTGSYIYEEFMPTDGTDVKVYTVGPDYAHAEARKSPALDGKVERDSEGKEVRYPVILNAREKLIAWKVCLAFKQTVCGFDLLRANGQSYVCDVNGFSFVKNSMKYYDDCAKILGNIVMRELAPQFHIPWSIPLEAEDIPIVPTTSGTMMELRCVIAVIRHGDRTPKQKMKMEVRHQKFFDLFEKCDGYKSGKLKLKKPKQLQEVLDIARQLLMELGQNNDSEIEENKSKLEQLKTVLEMYGHFSGINRKVQLTYLPHGCPKTSSEEEDSRREEPSLLLVLKWGGELTPAGRVQAEELGRAFRCMYPGGQGDYAGFPGCGLLRLHSTYRHDLKIYASDEGRVQMTAAAFAKGLLALEGELTPILVQMVKSANMNGLLDSDSDSLSSCQQRVKARLHEILQKDRDFTAEDYEKLTPSGSLSLTKSMHLIKNPVKTCDKVYSLIQSLTSQIRHRMEDPKSSDIQLYHSETLELMLRRWSKLEKDFKTKNGRYDISKIPDIYDCIKYDVQHNGSLKLENTMELYRLSKALADIVIPQEYGITKAEKLEIAKGYCTPLVRKIRSDLQRTQDDDTVNKLHPVYSRGVLSPERHVRTRLYFTSESHVHSLLSILRYGALCNESDEQWKRAMDYLNVVNELNYMTQIVIMLYEDPNKDLSSEERFHVELHFSPGAKGCEEDKNLPSGYGYRPASRESEGRRSFKTDSDDEPHSSKKDEVDRAVLMFKPMVSEPIHIHRKSPLPRSRKMVTNEVVSENANYLRTPRTLVEQKPNPTVGFELYSMVPSICPLETLHNALSLKQVDEFLASIASPSSDVPRKIPEMSSTASRSSPTMRRKVSLNTYTPAKILPTPPAPLKTTKASSKPG